MITVKKFYDLTLDELYAILKARVDVFVVEQTCPYPELDDIDKDAVHVFIMENNQVLGYCRVFRKNDTQAQIGRVLSTVRNKHYGKQVMEKGIEVARNIYPNTSIYIEAQCYAIGFYEKFGFKTISEPFLEDGIPHVQMILE